MYITKLELPLASSDPIMAGNLVASLPLSATRTNSTRSHLQPPHPGSRPQPQVRKDIANRPHQTFRSKGGNWRHSSARFLTEKLPRRDPHQTSAATAAPSTHKPMPTQLNGRTAAAASTHICRGLTITNHITFPIYRQPRFGPTLPTLSGCHYY